jgi:hypothetical protein
VDIELERRSLFDSVYERLLLFIICHPHQLEIDANVWLLVEIYPSGYLYYAKNHESAMVI